MELFYTISKSVASGLHIPTAPSTPPLFGPQVSDPSYSSSTPPTSVQTPIFPPSRHTASAASSAPSSSPSTSSYGKVVRGRGKLSLKAGKHKKSKKKTLPKERENQQYGSSGSGSSGRSHDEHKSYRASGMNIIGMGGKKGMGGKRGNTLFNSTRSYMFSGKQNAGSASQSLNQREKKKSDRYCK